MIFLFLSVLIIVGGSMIWTYGILRWFGLRPPPQATTPLVTVLVAGRNEEIHIERCLASLTSQSYLIDNTEIIYIDDHSSDRTLPLAEEFAAKYPVRVKVLSAPDCPTGIGPKKNALRYGIEQAKGEILAFIDADCVARPGWISALVREYDDETGCVAGAVLPEKRPTLLGKLLWLERLFISYTTASAMGCGFPASASGGSFSYRKQLYNQLGGLAFSQVPSGDDDLMAQAIARTGWKVKFARGRDCITEDLRSPDRRRYLNAAIRHQSTTRYYALRWRLIYIYSIFANIAFVALWVLAAIRPELLFTALATTALKWLLEGVSVKLFCRKLETGLSFIEFFLAETVLPVYILIRPLFATIPGFSWQNRTHRSSTISPDSGRQS
jgi:cellulose synthase/poly-beta-1,6-N-acetylglucosamine synthase-like glycosyltransferase